MEAAFLEDAGPRERAHSGGTGPSLLKYLWMALFLVGTVGAAVAIKRVQLAAEYPLAIVQITALSGVAVYPPIVVVALLSGRVRTSQARVAWWKPAAVAVGFVLHDGLLQIGGRGRLPGVLILVLLKLIIPCSMAFSMSRRTLGLVYSAPHWAGAAVVLAGALVVLPSQLRSFEGAASPWQACAQVLCVASSVVPEAAAFVLLETCLKGDDKNMFTVAFWMWVCFFMVPIIELLQPAGTALAGVPLSGMWANVYDGLQCYLLGVRPEHASSEHVRSCSDAQHMLGFAMVFSLLGNVSMPLCTRYGSATLLWFVRALSVPLAAILFASPSVMGKDATQMHLADWAGLALVMLGVLMFNYRDPGRG